MKPSATSPFGVGAAGSTAQGRVWARALVRGHAKVMCHLMLGVVALWADQLTRLLL
ncbi:MAG: hypothetical protein U5M53_04000 [Rhodoferax sp.]|nr:hypothetical protein [Rhodoferax sp.]